MTAVRLRHLSAVLLLTVLAHPAAAQDRKTTVTGSGNWQMDRNSPPEPLRAVQLTLTPQGGFELQLIGTRPLTRWTVKGQYTGEPWGRRIDLRVADALGTNRATGDGRVEFDQNNAPRQFTLRGRAGDRDFTLDFRGDGSGAGAPPAPRPQPQPRPGPDFDDDDRFDNNDGIGTFDFNRRSDGQGTLRSRDGNEEFERMRVQLRRDGTAELTTERGLGTRDHEVRARWRDNGNGRIQLDVVAFDGRRADGQGQLRLTGREFDRVNLQIRDNRGAIALNFTTDRFDGGYDDRNDGGDDVPESYNRRHEARGVIQLPDEGRAEVRDVRVQLNRNGAATIQVRTDLQGRNRTVNIRGRWEPNRNGAVTLRLERVDNTAITGSGQVVFWRGREASQVQLLGRARGGQLSLNVQLDR